MVSTMYLQALLLAVTRLVVSGSGSYKLPIADVGLPPNFFANLHQHAHSRVVVPGCEEECTELIQAVGRNVSLYVGANQSIYRFGDVIVGSGLRWQHDRNIIQNNKKYEGSLLQQYFSSHGTWSQHEVDWQVLGALCTTQWKQYAPTEPLTVHFRAGDNTYSSTRQVLDCAASFLSGSSEHSVDKTPQQIRLVAIQHYGANEMSGKHFATKSQIKKGNHAVAHVLNNLTAMGFNVSLQSSKDPDIDFCTVVQSQHTCLSQGGFDSVVYHVRKALGFRNEQSNFVRVRQFLWEPWSGKYQQAYKRPVLPADYQIDDLLYGTTKDSARKRSFVLSNAIFEGSLMQTYLRSHSNFASRTGDLHSLRKLCSDDHNFSEATEPLVISYDDTLKSDVDSLFECVTNFSSLLKPHSTVRIVAARHSTVMNVSDDGEILAKHEILRENGASRIFQQLLRQLKFSVVVDAARNADDQFCMLVTAENVCLHSGGLSKAVRAVRSWISR